MAKGVSNLVVDTTGTDVAGRRSVLLKSGTDMSVSTAVGGGGDPETTLSLPSTLAANARVAVVKAGAGPFTRRKINLIEGQGITVTLTDQPGTEQVDVQIDASGGGSGDVVGPSSSVASEVALFDGATGKLLKRAAVTGIAKLTSGVLSAATAGTDYYAPGSTDVAVADGGTGSSTAAGARTNLGLGGAAVLSVGTTAGTVAAGDDSRITGAAQKSANLSDLASASTARTNLGLGSAAVLDAATTPAASGLLQLDAVGFFGMAAALTAWRYSFGLATFTGGVVSFVGMANPTQSGTGGTGSTFAYTNRFATANSGFAQNTRLVKRAVGFALMMTFKLPSSVTSRRLWIGLTSATMTDSDTAPGHFVGVRYSTVAGDAGFMPASRDGTTQTIGAAGSAPVADVPYMLVMSGATGGSSVRVLVYRLDTSATVLDATITATLPGSTTDTDWVLYCHGQGNSRAVEISQVVRLIDVT